ncbi:hypothetical protein GCM10017600_07920 [Streptosporangium carneum]|uniref:Uncharacterized protein n=1 Tax=Streptosporangium carneum TaxID=47481 RepID=A0A9W6HWM4_9ACTN|nr:hypothetical protein [Streptosporangium carneum]GLK07387.1 hypothetical protein GCM10017600_07920 [Streptosporangium carneum]
MTIQALAVPLRGGTRAPLARGRELTTAQHAELLRAVLDWATGLPEETQALEVREDLDSDGQFTARLVLPAGVDPSSVSGLIMSVTGSKSAAAQRLQYFLSESC